MTLSKALTTLWEFVQDYCAKEKIDVPNEAVEARKILESMVAEKEMPTTYEDVKKAREVWFKELLEIFLPDTLNKMIRDGEIKITRNNIF